MAQIRPASLPSALLIVELYPVVDIVERGGLGAQFRSFPFMASLGLWCSGWQNYSGALAKHLLALLCPVRLVRRLPKRFKVQGTWSTRRRAEARVGRQAGDVPEVLRLVVGCRLVEAPLLLAFKIICLRLVSTSDVRPDRQVSSDGGDHGLERDGEGKWAVG